MAPQCHPVVQFPASSLERMVEVSPDYLTAFLTKTPPCGSLSGTFDSCPLNPEYNPSYLRSTHTGGAYLSINPEDLTEKSHLQVVDRCLQLYTNSNLDAPTTFVNVLSLLHQTTETLSYALAKNLVQRTASASISSSSPSAPPFSETCSPSSNHPPKTTTNNPTSLPSMSSIPRKSWT